MLNHNFNRKIRGIIKKLEYPVWIVVLDKSRQCTCRDNNEVPDAQCMKCLGTGYRIKIIQRKAAIEPNDASIRISNQQQNIPSNYYYFSADEVSIDEIRQDNIIIRDDEVDILLNPKPFRSDSNSPIYFIVEGVDKKVKRDVFLDNFRKLVSK